MDLDCHRGDPAENVSQGVTMHASIELNATLGGMRPLLMKLARLQLRNEAWAEDVVSETMIAAIEQSKSFEARSKLRTWVIGILKHKIVDHLRRQMREVAIEAQIEAGDIEDFDDLVRDDGRRVTPVQNWGDPEELLSRQQFFAVLQTCVDGLPVSLGRIFLLREWLEFDTAEICKELNITATNCHVMLFRARMRLRECIDVKWNPGKVMQ
jgi:RNA polymerase sigma-70 factor (ECF subfamily)